MLKLHLSQEKCVACEGGVAPLTRDEATVLLRHLSDWTLADDATLLSKEYVFDDFAQALAFLERVGALAEAEGHHPDIHLTQYRHLRLELYTHAIGGLSRNDFILAAKVDSLLVA